MQVNKLPSLNSPPAPLSNTVAILTVSQLTQAIKSQLESRFRFVYLQGELTNLKLQSSGHLYFSLKDADAQISAVMFRADLATSVQMPKLGDQVVVSGEISVYAPRGNYQLIVRQLRHVGLGELLQKLEELKQKLHLRGWFALENKKKLPQLPQKIGVVTSPTGAVIQDIINILKRRFAGFQLLLNPVKVQGDGAAAEIAAAIDFFNQHALVDVIIIGRGGGSLEDLWPFNEEIVAEAIFRSEIPIISAVGHETDHSIADLVADVRAPTPSAAAEIVIGEKQSYIRFLQQTQGRLLSIVQQQLSEKKQQVRAFLCHPILSSPYILLARPLQQIDDKRSELELVWKYRLQRQKAQLLSYMRQLSALKPQTQIAHHRKRCSYLHTALIDQVRAMVRQHRGKLMQAGQSLQINFRLMQAHRRKIFQSALLKKQLKASFAKLIDLRCEKLSYLAESLKAVDPRNLLKKGYSIVFSENKESVILSVEQLKKNGKIKIRLSDGEVIAHVDQIISIK